MGRGRPVADLEVARAVHHLEVLDLEAAAGEAPGDLLEVPLVVVVAGAEDHHVHLLGAAACPRA